MHALRDSDGVDWNEPFDDLLGQDQRVRDEGYVLLGESVISSRIMDAILGAALAATATYGAASAALATQVGFELFDDHLVWGRLSAAIAGSWALCRVAGRLLPGRSSFLVSCLYAAVLVARHPGRSVRPVLLQAAVCAVVVGVSALAGPLCIRALRARYQQASFGHRLAVSHHQTDMLSDLVGRNVREARTRELGEAVRAGYRRMLAARVGPDDPGRLGIRDFHAVVPDRTRAKAVFLLFALHTEAWVSKRKYLETCSDIVHDHHRLRRTKSRSSSMFVVLAGLLDFVVAGLTGIFCMAVSGFSVLHMMAAAIFVYGLVNNFFGEAIVQWKAGAYFVLGCHPYDIGDTVSVPGVSARGTSLQVVDFSLTTTLFRRSEGQMVTVQHRDIAFKVVTNLSRNRKNRIVLTLSADEGAGLPIAQVIQRLLRFDVPDYFRQDYTITMVKATRYGLDPKPKVELTYAAGLSAKQRLRGLVRFCSLLKEAALDAQVDEEN